MSRGAWGGVLAIVLGTGAAAAQAQTSFDPAREAVRGELGKAIDRYLSAAARFGFSGEVLVAADGAVALHRAYGWADPTRREPLTVTTPVGIASMSKRFASAAALRLVADGKLSLDARLGDLLDGVPADKSGLTLRQLLVHSSGLRGGFEEDFEETDVESSLRRILGQPLVDLPGEHWHYSSEAYNLVAAIVERRAGERYEEFVRRRLLEPLGLAATGFLSEPPPGAARVARARVGVRDNGSPADWPRNWRSRGGGDLVSTAGDLYRAHLGFAAGKVLPAGLAAQQLAAQFPIGEGVSYGFGVMLSSDERGRLVEWAGDTELGYNGVLFDYPDRHVTVVVLCPSRDAFGRSLRQLVQAEILQMAFGERVPPFPDGPTPDPATAERWIGSWPLADGDLTFFTDGAQLWLTPRGRGATRTLLAALGIEPPAPEAGDRTLALLARLMRGDSTAIAEALGAEGAAATSDYLGEWQALLAEEGPLHGYRLLGEAPRRGSVQVLAQLELRDGVRTMSWNWSEGGRGRLAGSNPSAYGASLLLAVGVVSESSLIACDAWRVTCATFAIAAGGGLEANSGDRTLFTTAPATRAGWSAPPFRESAALRR